MPGTTPEIFKQFSEHVVKIEVVETGSAAKASIGTGFFADSAGRIVTNYHVISKLIHSPDRYRIEVTDVAGGTTAATVLGVDVVYDLAVLRTNRRPKGYLTWNRKRSSRARGFILSAIRAISGFDHRRRHLQRPAEAYALSESSFHRFAQSGHERRADSDASRPSRRCQRRHRGRADQLSRAGGARHRFARKNRKGRNPPPASFLAEVGRQIHANQKRYLAGMFAGKTPTVVLGPYDLPTKPTEFFRCWADAVRRKELPYVAVTHDCSTDDYIFVSSEQSSGIVRFYHQLLSTGELNPARFFTLYSAQLQGGNAAMFGNEEEVTSFRCQTRNVATAQASSKRCCARASTSSCRVFTTPCFASPRSARAMPAWLRRLLSPA